MIYDGSDLIGAWELRFINDVDNARIGYLYDVDSEVVSSLREIAVKHKATRMEFIQGNKTFIVEINKEEHELEGTSGVVSE